MTNKRDCENCAHARPFGGENDNRCDAWECEFIDRQEAIKAYKARREKEEEECMGVKEMLDRLYAYKNGAEDDNLIDDVIQLIIDLDRMTWSAPSGATWNVGASNGWKGE